MSKTAQYTDDNGTKRVVVITDRQAAMTATEHGLVPVDNTEEALPDRFEPRGVYAYDSTDRSKRVFITCNTGGTLYNDNSSTFTFDGGSWKTTGRRGEDLTFVSYESIT